MATPQRVATPIHATEKERLTIAPKQKPEGDGFLNLIYGALPLPTAKQKWPAPTVLAIVVSVIAVALTFGALVVGRYINDVERNAEMRGATLERMRSIEKEIADVRREKEEVQKQLDKANQRLDDQDTVLGLKPPKKKEK